MDEHTETEQPTGEAVTKVYDVRYDRRWAPPEMKVAMRYCCEDYCRPEVVGFEGLNWDPLMEDDAAMDHLHTANVARTLSTSPEVDEEAIDELWDKHDTTRITAAWDKMQSEMEAAAREFVEGAIGLTEDEFEVMLATNVKMGNTLGTKLSTAYDELADDTESEARTMLENAGYEILDD